jgi:RND family efflux transporter MFP subunit
MGDSVEQGQSLLELDATPLRLERDAASADIHRFDAQIDNEERRVERLKKLSTREYVARTQLDDAEAQLAVYRAEREAAQARLAIAEDKIERARVPAHVGGEVERRYISEGDFVKRGDPLFDITEPKSLQAWLPLPETVAGRLVRGQQVLLWSPLARDVRVEAKLDDLRPSVGAGSRAVTAIVDVTNPGPWRPEATVVARILVERRENAVLVPTLALVRRPAGDVVYLIGNGQARARIVRTGQRLDGMVEILEGIEGDETVAVEGAAWLTDGAAVRVAEAQQ